MPAGNPMAQKTDLTLLYDIAHSYYIDNLTQSEIAEQKHISRSHISRLLDKAKELGIVKITVSLPEYPSDLDLARSVASFLGIHEVVIAPVKPDETDTEAVTEAIANTAATFVPQALRGYKTVGLGWGQTVYKMSVRLGYKNLGKNRLYVPLVGVAGSTNPHLQINSIVDRVAERHRARTHFVNVRAIRPASDPLSRHDEKSIAALESYWKHLDAAVIGLGTPPVAGGLYTEEIDLDINDKVASSGAVGDILSYFFFSDGTAVDFGRDYRHLAYPLKDLPKLRKVICLAGGPEKTESILAAARLHYFDTLVTDSNTALAFYEKCRD